MSFEKGILNIIIQYCGDVRFSFDDLVTTCSAFSKKPEYLFRAKFSLLGCDIEASLKVDRLVVQQKSAPNILLHDANWNVHHKEKLKSLITSGKFLSFLYFANQEITCPKLQDSQCSTSEFLEIAQFTAVENPKLTLCGLLQGEFIRIPDRKACFYDLQFCPQEWMGNPSDVETLRCWLEDLNESSTSWGWKKQVNQNFEQQFAWWTKKDQTVYQKEIGQSLSDCFSSCCHQ